jgi:redox-sensitive bicupin YhaK (pirin superfamily)
MITVRKSLDRGHADHGWLESYHTFSFADYHDPSQMGFRDLRVINEDRVQPAKGFETHSHQNMEIVSYVLAGSLAHEDNLGNGSTICPGDVQRMSAGTGVTHSEFNQSKTKLVHFLQIWILPEREGIEPGYEQKHFGEAARDGTLCLVASRDGRDGSISIHQDVDIYASLLGPTQRVEHAMRRGRYAWVQVARGVIELNGIALESGDGAALSDETAVTLAAQTSSEVLVFDLR